MMTNRGIDHGRPNEEFAQQAQETPPNFILGFWDFLIHNKKWWLTPIIVILLLMGCLIFLSSTVIAPFVYPGL